MGRERIPEEDDQIELPLRDHRADLRVTAAWATEQRAHGGADRVGHELRGVSRAAELRIAEQRAVPGGPLDHVLLLSIVRDERDPLSCVHDEDDGRDPAGAASRRATCAAGEVTQHHSLTASRRTRYCANGGARGRAPHLPFHPSPNRIGSRRWLVGRKSPAPDANGGGPPPPL